MLIFTYSFRKSRKPYWMLFFCFVPIFCEKRAVLLTAEKIDANILKQNVNDVNSSFSSLNRICIFIVSLPSIQQILKIFHDISHYLRINNENIRMDTNQMVNQKPHVFMETGLEELHPARKCIVDFLDTQKMERSFLLVTWVFMTTDLMSGRLSCKQFL